MSSAMRKELAETGVKVTCIQPGDVKTAISNNDTDQEVWIQISIGQRV